MLGKLEATWRELEGTRFRVKLVSLLLAELGLFYADLADWIWVLPTEGARAWFAGDGGSPVGHCSGLAAKAIAARRRCWWRKVPRCGPAVRTVAEYALARPNRCRPRPNCSWRWAATRMFQRPGSTSEGSFRGKH